MRPPLLVLPLVVLLGCTAQTVAPSVDTTSVAFGEVPVGQTRQLSITVTNPSARTMDLGFAANEPFAFGFTRASVPPGARISVPLAFTPTETLDYQRTGDVVAGSGAVPLELTGRGIVGTDDGCGNAGTCRVYRRVDGGCELATAPNGTACATKCAPQGLCVEGVCEGFNPACDDANACTTDSCVEGVGCRNDRISCSTPSPCQTPYCDPIKGCSLANVTDGTPCGSTTCGAVDVCKAGTCVRLNQTTPNCLLNTCGGGAPLNGCSRSFCFENPLPTYGGFTDGVALSANDVWFVNPQSGGIFRWDGGTFAQHMQPGGSLSGLLVKSENDVWVTATDMPPRHWNGANWTAAPLLSGDYCYSIAQTASGEVVCAGYSRLYVLTSGSAQPIGGDTGGNSIVRAGGGATWSVGASGQVRRVLGAAGSTFVGNVASTPRDLTVDLTGRAWIATLSGGLVRWDQSGSSVVAVLGGYVDSVSAVGANKVLAISGGGLYSYVDGDGTAQFIASTGNTGGGFTAEPFTAANENDVWIQGNELSHYDGLGTKVLSCGSEMSDVHLIRATLDGGAFAASYSQLYRREVSRWSQLAGSSYSFVELWPASSTEVFAVTNNGQLMRASVTAPTPVAMGPAGRHALSVWGAGPNDIYAGIISQQNEPVMHYDGASWSRANTPDAGNSYLMARSIDGASADDVWVLVRNQNTYRYQVWHYDGTAWRDTNFPVTTQELGNIRRHAGSVRVLVRYQAYLYEWNGASWVTRPAPYSLIDVAEVNGELYGATSTELIHLTKDGGFSTVRTINVGIRSLTRIGGGELLVSSNYGYIAKLRP